jgi:hypothetical protein
MSLENIERALHDAGLSPRGAFHPAAGDDVPPLAAGTPAQAHFHMRSFLRNHRPKNGINHGPSP